VTIIERVIALQRTPLFAEVPGRTLAAVALRATEVDAGVGTRLIAEGAVEDHLFVLVHGRLRVEHGGITLTTLEAGATVGELAALVPEPRSASVTVVEPALLLRIEKAVLDELLVDLPELAGAVIRSLVTLIRSRTPEGRAATAAGRDPRIYTER
jgi:CRP-like cAMP-binding protein